MRAFKRCGSQRIRVAAAHLLNQTRTTKPSSVNEDPHMPDSDENLDDVLAVIILFEYLQLGRHQ